MLLLAPSPKPMFGTSSSCVQCCLPPTFMQASAATTIRVGEKGGDEEANASHKEEPAPRSDRKRRSRSRRLDHTQEGQPHILGIFFSELHGLLVCTRVYAHGAADRRGRFLVASSCNGSSHPQPPTPPLAPSPPPTNRDQAQPHREAPEEAQCVAGCGSAARPPPPLILVGLEEAPAAPPRR